MEINSNLILRLELIKKDIPRIELGLLDSKSNVLTITPYVLPINLCGCFHLWSIDLINRLIQQALAYKCRMSDVQYYDGVAITILVLNIISLCSLSFVIITYIIRWKFIASFPMRLSFYLCISCLVQNLYVIFYPPSSLYNDTLQNGDLGRYCVFEAMLKTSFDLSSIIWTSIIMYCSYASVVRQSSLDKMEFFYLGLGFFLPILVALVPIFLGYYGPNIYFCWFDADNTSIQFWLKIGYYFGPLWILFLLESFWVFKTYSRLKQLGLKGRQLNIFKKILLFPLILFITGVFPTIDLIYVYSTGNFLEWLDIFSYCTLSAYGLCTSLAYGFNPLIQDQILSLFQPKRSSISRESSSVTDSSRGAQKIAQLMAI